MTPADINQYVGLRWAAGARGPDAFDCWGLLRHLQAEHFGISIPDVPGFGEAARDLYHERMSSHAWEIVSFPFHGAGVLMRGGDDPHVGVWLDLEGGGVLHSMEGVGVIWSSRASLRMLSFSRMKFYRFHD
ncbi:NlpC/P60 family protein [Burkholderia sp. LMG 13014]|uniref:NlpC/P60 family protein n=1 Tax=Burkholderia sp. LMG 13014 TaxID=2709306 RepID=UPI0019623201|nr:NlpC/P60 family protein [Burkholderia sp. LMG 13014]